MAHGNFMPTLSDFRGCLAHAVEEFGEATAAAGKTLRYGPESYNPLLEEADRERNGDWLLRELDDAEHAIRRLRASLLDSGFVPGVVLGAGR